MKELFGINGWNGTEPPPPETSPKQDGRVEELNPELWCGLLDYITVGENKMVFTFRDGTEVKV
jgi:hypothetical protein